MHVRPRTESPEPGQPTAAERYSVSVQVGILTKDGRMCGNVRDISVSGARIEHTSYLPPEGSTLQLGFAFYAHALPVPMQARVVRHIEGGGFAVEFEEVDFRTQVLLRSLLPNVSSEGFPAEGVHLNEAGHLELDLPPVLMATCAKVAEQQGLHIEDWIVAQLEAAALDGLD